MVKRLDGNNYTITWKTNTVYGGRITLELQPDANLVLYSEDRKPLWTTDTYKSGS